ncbi:hypothetical protein BDZ85DRAFT_178635, partial [Elsinoe ampelina]
VGFTHPFSLPLYLLTAGALAAFSLSRLPYLALTSRFRPSSIPGEWFHLRSGHRRAGILLHLIGVLFGSLLAVHQFTPVLRRKYPLVHRVVGHVAILLFLVGNAGAFMILDTSVGGTLAMRTWTGLVGAGTTVAVGLAYVNVRRRQIDLHRAWMLRTWGWAGNIITLRLILGMGMGVSFAVGAEFEGVFRCEEVVFMYEDMGVRDGWGVVRGKYPACSGVGTEATRVVVMSEGGGPEGSAVRMRALFLMAAWLAIAIHVALVELYLALTPGESHRLRVLSRERQIARGMITAESEKEAGLGAGRLGDAPKW